MTEFARKPQTLRLRAALDRISFGKKGSSSTLWSYKSSKKGPGFLKKQQDVTANEKLKPVALNKQKLFLTVERWKSGDSLKLNRWRLESVCLQLRNQKAALLWSSYGPLKALLWLSYDPLMTKQTNRQCSDWSVCRCSRTRIGCQTGSRSAMWGLGCWFAHRFSRCNTERGKPS